MHRLDRFTSGVLLVAKHDAAHRRLAEQFAGREVRKDLPGAGARRSEGFERTDRAPDRTRSCASYAHDGAPGGGPRGVERSTAVLRSSRVSRCWKFASGQAARTRSGAHSASIKHPVVGDTLYGAAAQPELGRYFLHAHRIEVSAANYGEEIAVVSPLAPELEAWLERL